MSTIYAREYFLRHGGGTSVAGARGETGPRGEPGARGESGVAGPQGEPGIGIVSAKIDGGKLIFTLSNGTTLDAGNLLELIKSVMPAAQPAPVVRAVGAVRPPQ
jgi:hypothetical protein